MFMFSGSVFQRSFPCGFCGHIQVALKKGSVNYDFDPEGKTKTLTEKNMRKQKQSCQEMSGGILMQNLRVPPPCSIP